MATFAPVITTSSPVTVKSGVSTITYNELLQSIKGGGYQNKVNSIYIKASSFAQLSSNWSLRKPTQNGFLDITPTGYLIDPAQKQPTAFLNLKEYDFVLDTLSSINMQMQPYSNSTLIVFADAQTIGGAFLKKENSQQPTNTFEDKKNVAVVKVLPKQNNEVAKKVFVAVASVGIIYLILTKI